VLGFQDIAGLEVTYGEKATQELLGQVGNVAILRLNNPQTADWAERVFSEEEIVRWNQSESTTTGGNQGSQTVGVSEHHEVRPLVRRSQFLSIPPPNPPHIKELGGFYRTPGVAAYPWALPLDLVREHLPPLAEEPSHARQLQGPGFLPPWTPEERAALRLPSDSEQPPPRPAPDKEPEAPRREDDGLDYR